MIKNFREASNVKDIDNANVKNSDKNAETKKIIEEKTTQNNNATKSPNFVDITKEQSFWDKAVPS